MGSPSAYLYFISKLMSKKDFFEQETWTALLDKFLVDFQQEDKVLVDFQQEDKGSEYHRIKFVSFVFRTIFQYSMEKNPQNYSEFWGK